MSNAKISIITPTHNPKFLQETFDSLLAQTFKDWEWVIVPNGNGLKKDYSKYEKDSRVRIVPFNSHTNFIGEIKGFAFKQGRGEILLELDHDDLLTPWALEDCVKAFEDPKIDFVHSNTANFENETWKPTQDYNPAYGWKYREVEVYDKTFREAIGFDVTPQSLSLIYYAPNHFRAWRKDFYKKIGGHNPKLQVCDDQDLVIRTYLEGEIFHIDKLGYLYRVYGGNAWLKHNQLIQRKTQELYTQYAGKLVERWCDKNKFRKIDLGGRFNSPAGWESVDLKDADVIADLNKRWPFEDNSIGAIRAWDIFEHLPDKQHTISEVHRVLRPGGYLLSGTPSTDGRGAFQDPTHVSFWNQNSFYYYTRQEQAKFIDNTDIRFQVSRLDTRFPNKWCEDNKIPYVVADLVKIPDKERLPGLIEI